ncbi:hypothetical protein L9F63_025508, partial [Diploptera punctata]
GMQKTVCLRLQYKIFMIYEPYALTPANLVKAHSLILKFVNICTSYNSVTVHNTSQNDSSTTNCGRELSTSMFMLRSM